MKESIKYYDILLDNQKIGKTSLENADETMGVVFGKIIFTEKVLSFDFLCKYCEDNLIAVTKHPEDKLILTRIIPTLKVINEIGVEIEGECNIEGMDSDGFDIYVFK
jgi:hypothetical protein